MRIIIVLCIQLWAVTSLVWAADRLDGPIAAQVIRVIDGDTIMVRAKIWLDTELTIRVRVDGIDTPEIFRPRCPRERQLAEQAKALVEDQVGLGQVTLYDIHYGKYAGRVIARVETRRGDLAEALRAAGYNDKDWCAPSINRHER
ncbi:MAG: thermonuclease family protein [bacterium]